LRATIRQKIAACGDQLRIRSQTQRGFVHDAEREVGPDENIDGDVDL